MENFKLIENIIVDSNNKIVGSIFNNDLANKILDCLNDAENEIIFSSDVGTEDNVLIMVGDNEIKIPKGMVNENTSYTIKLVKKTFKSL